MKNAIMRRLLAFLLAIVSAVAAFMPCLTVEASAASNKDEKFPYVAVLGEAKNGRKENYDFVLKIPKGATVAVLGTSPNYPHRLVVAFGEHVVNVTSEKVDRKDNYYVAALPENKNLRDNNYNYITEILKNSIVIVEGDCKKYSGRKEIIFGDFGGSIGSKGVTKMTAKEAEKIVKAGKSSVGGSQYPNTSGMKYYLAVSNQSYEVFRCYGPVKGESSYVWIDKNFDGKIDGKLKKDTVQKVDSEAIIVSRTDQKVYVIRNGKVVLSSVCRTGTKYPANPKKNRETNLGIHEILEMKWGTDLKGYNSKGEYYSRPVKVWIKINLDAEGLHDAPWLNPSLFGGDTYLYNGSLGCVNLPTAFAIKLYEKYAEVGEMVIVSDTSMRNYKK